MHQLVFPTVLIAAVAAPLFAQPPAAAAKFDAADVHVSPKSLFTNSRTGPASGGRYEFKNATMLDLIRTAFGLDSGQILGGPNWLEVDRFDVIAKVPAGTTPDTQKRMLQSLLEERFKLVIHQETKPIPGYALTAGKKPQLKKADGAGETGCQPERATGANRAHGLTWTPVGGPGVMNYTCRNMTMEAFAAGLRDTMGSSLGTGPVLDQTGLKGKYSFKLHYSPVIGGIGGEASDRISIFDAVDRQLGLKLEARPVPAPVVVVDSVNRRPSKNPPGTAEALPTLPTPKEFEVASVKPTGPDNRTVLVYMHPGGQLILQGQQLGTLVNRAFYGYSSEQIRGLPDWANTERLDIVAQVPSWALPAIGMDNEWFAPMLRSLLAKRLNMAYHIEDRNVTGYALMAAKPKMKRADPNSRTFCRNSAASPGSPSLARVLHCQNVTMEQFAERLRGMSQELFLPVIDRTGLSGGWDITLSYTVYAASGAAAHSGEPEQQSAMAAADPSGGIALFQGLEKQLGLKLEKQKRTAPVIVIDRIGRKPTAN